MSDQSTLLNQIAANQSNKEVTANGLFDAASPATTWGRRDTTTSALTWGYYGGYFNGNAIANGTVTLTASATNYVYANASTGAVSVSTSSFPAGSITLYQITTNATSVTNYLDRRQYAPVALVPAAGTNPYDMPMFFPGTMTNSQILARIIFTRSVNFPISLTGSQFSAGNAATGSTTVTLNKNGSSIGTLLWAAAATVPTVTFSSAVTFAAGDILTIVAPSTADASLANVSLTFNATR
ncbi:hypothetical protein [Cupriavidus sp. BIC8F]|uniref:hypothetical protein n=1 Tax=Cupriavidus sp. BIC8F TaxID=3079014 RepID=UPI002915ED6F|nr:hypothetical protein [Cupriavidus sp. BIC8F]